MLIFQRTPGTSGAFRCPRAVECDPVVEIKLFVFWLMKVTYLRINVLVSSAGIFLVVSAGLKMQSIQGFHQIFEPLGVKIEIPLKVPDSSNMFFHLIKNIFHEVSSPKCIG